MTNFEIYTFILCLIVFILLTSLSVFSICLIVKMYLRLVKVGDEDDKLIKENNKMQNKKQSKFGKGCDYALTLIMVAFFIVVFSCSLYINCTQNTYFENIPTYRVVKTGSMAKKHEKNTYLIRDNLNDQIQTFDLILTYKVPKEEDLKVYDIVVYEVDDMLIVHRIVGIEDPNEKHPNERWFLLQGDAVEAPDRFPVLYDQIKGIYRGEKIPFIGSFVLFMQSPAGWLCMILLVFAVIATPIVEKRIEKEKQARISAILANENTQITETALTSDRFTLLKGKKNEKSFTEKLDILPFEDTCWYIDISSYIDGLGVFTRGTSDKVKSYNYKNKTVIKMSVKGKTVNLYLALNPQNYNQTKYTFVDVSLVKKYSSTPMRIKITSNRQLKYAKELIADIVSGFNNGE